MAKSQKYWEKRAEQRLVLSEQTGTKLNYQNKLIYEKALKAIESDIESIYRNYAKKGILSKEDLQKTINPQERKEFLQKVKLKAAKLGINSDKVFDDRYLSRLSRLEALKLQTRLEILDIAPLEDKNSTGAYTDVLKKAYSLTQDALNEQGVNSNFATLDNKVVTQILKSKWEGGNYSSRIWNNVNKLSQQLPEILGHSLVSGRSSQKTSRLIRDQFGVGIYESARLVRTETNYFHNQAELQSYIDDAIEEYDYLAELDTKTSTICRGLNGRTFKVSEARVGENYPPMHPWCRSTAVARPNISKIGKKPTEAQRVERLTPFDSDSIKDKWKAAMQRQMNPNKVEGRDYNADMNLLTRTYKGTELIAKISELMKEIPQDYGLRTALEMAAKLNGWKPT